MGVINPEHSLMLIMLSKLTGEESREEIYDRTRFAWKTKIERAQLVDYVISHNSNDEVVGVFKAKEWLKADDDIFSSIDRGSYPDRIGFVGEEAEDAILALYQNCSVPKRKKGAANPIRYLESGWSEDVSSDENLEENEEDVEDWEKDFDELMAQHQDDPEPQNTEEKVKKIIKDQFGYVTEVTNDSNFIDDLKAEFTDFNTLFMTIEVDLEFDIDAAIEASGYEDNELFIKEKVPTVQALADYVVVNESNFRIDEDSEPKIIFDAEKYDGLLVDLRGITEELSKEQLFKDFNILDSEFQAQDFNEQGFYKLSMNEDTLEDVEFLGSDYFNVDPMHLQNEMMGINYKEGIAYSDIIQLEAKLEPGKVSVQCFPDPDHWQHGYWIHFVKLNPYI
jgi:acyl carrier protein